MGKIAHLQEIPTADLVPYQANAKTHGKKQIEQLKKCYRLTGIKTGARATKRWPILPARVLGNLPERSKHHVLY